MCSEAPVEQSKLGLGTDFKKASHFGPGQDIKRHPISAVTFVAGWEREIGLTFGENRRLRVD